MFFRIFWGLMYDKIGYRKCMMIIGACVTVVIPSLPLLTLLGKYGPTSFWTC